VPLAKARLGVDEAAFGQLLLFMGLGAISAMAVSSRLIALVGTGRLIAAGYAVLVISLLALVFLDASITFAAALLLFGASGGMMDVAMNAFAAETEARIGRPVMSSIHGMWSVGGLAGASLGSALFIFLPGPGQAIVISFILSLLFLFVWPRIAVAGPAPAHSTDKTWHVAGWVWVVAMLACLCFSIEGSVRDWSAIYLGTALAAPQAKAAWGFAAYSACMGGARFAGDWIRRRAEEGTIVLACGVLAAAGFALAASSAAYPAAIVGFALAGIGLSNIVPIFISVAGRSPNPAASIAVVVTAGYAGLLASPPALGALAGWASLAAMFLAVGCVALLIAASFLALTLGRR
jgi:MFS family permease